MAKIRIQNPDKLNQFKFAVNYESYSTKHIGSNSELHGESVYWSICNTNDLSKDYRISLMLDSEIQPGDFVGKFRVIIHSLETAVSRVKFLTREEIGDLEEFGKMVSLEISNMEYRTANFLPF